MTHKYLPGTFLFFTMLVHCSWGQCLNLYVSLTDGNTGTRIRNARLEAEIGKKKQSFGKEKGIGYYEISLPCSATSLLVNKEGYRSVALPVYPAEGNPENVYFLPVPLTPIDKQAHDNPYFQSEQTHYELKNQGKHAGNKKTIRVFNIRDAANSRLSIPAEICLYFTQTGLKKCALLTAQDPAFTVAFNETDIIALEVSAPGYETYTGNLILDQLDGQTKNYSIYMDKQLTFLSVISPPGHTSWLLKPSEKQQLTTLDKTHQYALTSPGTYTLQNFDSRGVLCLSRNVSLKKGLNILTLPAQLPVSTVNSETANASSYKFPNKWRDTLILFFDQSSYLLRPDSKAKLDSLSQILRNTPGQKIQINGYTDHVGNPELNKTLSEFRAKVVSSYLTHSGVPEQQLSYRGNGDKKVIHSNLSNEERIKKRRVEIIPVN